MLIVFILTFFGFLLIYLEFFLPGIILGASGAILLLFSLIYLAWQGASLGSVLLYFALIIFLLIGTTKLALYFIRASSKKGTICLGQDQEGFQSVSYPKEYIGKVGVVTHDLKPMGYIDIEGKSIAALSKEGYLEKGTKVTVIGGEGNYLIVRQ